MTRIFFALSGLFLATLLTAQDINRARMDSLLDVLAANDRFMGSVSIMRAGEVIYAKAVGYADLASKIKADPETRYRVGSVSKTFTTVLVFKAVEEGKLRLDESLGKYYPAIPNASRITLEQMLGHRSGIYSVTDNSLYLSWNTQPQTEAGLVARILAGKPVFEPGAKAEYSNSNFILLTFILERAYGKPYAQLLQEKIVQPLGLKHTKVGGRIDPGQHEARSYEYSGSWTLSSETDMSIPLGAVAIISTPSDINRFATALFDGKLIRKEHVDRMKTMQDGFGLGLFSFPYYGATSYGHTGGIDGFRSVYSYFPEERLGYALTTNALRYEMNNISIAMLNGVFGKPFPLPVFKNVSLSVAELDRLTGDYVSKDLPITVTIRHDGKQLIAHPSGQTPLALDAHSATEFVELAVGVEFVFTPAEGKMQVKQGGQAFQFTRK